MKAMVLLELPAARPQFGDRMTTFFSHRLHVGESFPGTCGLNPKNSNLRRGNEFASQLPKQDCRADRGNQNPGCLLFLAISRVVAVNPDVGVKGVHGVRQRGIGA